jgi:hypothetical protein
MPRGSKPGERRGGRTKGIPNKLTGELKDMILTALAEAGGVDYLKKQAESSPTAFMSLVGKVLPLTVNGPGEDGAHKLVVEIVRYGKDNAA